MGNYISNFSDTYIVLDAKVECHYYMHLLYCGIHMYLFVDCNLIIENTQLDVLQELTLRGK